jgi:hypothetical protein
VTVRTLGWILALTVVLVATGCGGRSSADAQPSREDFFISKGRLDDPALINDIWGLMIGPDEEATLQKATRGQRMLYVLSSVEGEINNGGFHQLFWNSTGEWTEEAIGYADELGASRAAELLRRAAGLVFPDGVPKDRVVRQTRLDEVDPSRFGAVEDAWFGELVTVDPFLRRYIKEHPKQFFNDA